MRLFALLAACGCVSGISVAAPTFLDGAYGNKEGCLYARTGTSSGADSFFVLNDEGITTATAYCQFEGSATPTAKGFTIRTRCTAEGETDSGASEGGDAPAQETVALDRSAAGYTIRFEDGTTWGPLAQCRT
jgi:hypothetical protein